jgi:hypothetical protein
VHFDLPDLPQEHSDLDDYDKEEYNQENYDHEDYDHEDYDQGDDDQGDDDQGDDDQGDDDQNHYNWEYYSDRHYDPYGYEQDYSDQDSDTLSELHAPTSPTYRYSINMIFVEITPKTFYYFWMYNAFYFVGNLIYSLLLVGRGEDPERNYIQPRQVSPRSRF